MPGVPRDVGVLGETMCFDLHLRRFCERLTARGMDSPSKRHQEGMPSGPLTFHSSNGRLGTMHIAGVFARGPDRILVC